LPELQPSRAEAALHSIMILSQTIFYQTFFSGIRPIIIATTTGIALSLLINNLARSQPLFGLESILLNDWLLIFTATSPVMLIVELEMFVQRKLNKHLLIGGSVRIYTSH
jgi:hypothetical protein